MNSKEFNELLLKLGACDDAVKWASGKSWNEVFETCDRGDWLLWLFKKTNPDDLRLLTLAKGHCAATVLHLMEDERSKLAVQSAIDYGNGEIGDKELAASAASAASAAYYAASAYASSAAKKENQLLTANIVRKYIPIEKWRI